jgi:hypothetical protein
VLSVPADLVGSRRDTDDCRLGSLTPGKYDDLDLSSGAVCTLIATGVYEFDDVSLDAGSVLRAGIGVSAQLSLRDNDSLSLGDDARLELTTAGSWIFLRDGSISLAVGSSLDVTGPITLQNGDVDVEGTMHVGGTVHMPDGELDLRASASVLIDGTTVVRDIRNRGGSLTVSSSGSEGAQPGRPENALAQ